MIETIADLKKALEAFPEEMKVRNVFDAGGNYYFPHLKLDSARWSHNQEPVIIMGQERATSLGAIRDIIDIPVTLASTLDEKAEKVSDGRSFSPTALEIVETFEGMMSQADQETQNKVKQCFISTIFAEAFDHPDNNSEKEPTKSVADIMKESNGRFGCCAKRDVACEPDGTPHVSEEIAQEEADEIMQQFVKRIASSSPETQQRVFSCLNDSKDQWQSLCNKIPQSTALKENDVLGIKFAGDHCKFLTGAFGNYLIKAAEVKCNSLDVDVYVTIAASGIDRLAKWIRECGGYFYVQKNASNQSSLDTSPTEIPLQKMAVGKDEPANRPK